MNDSVLKDKPVNRLSPLTTWRRKQNLFVVVAIFLIWWIFSTYSSTYPNIATPEVHRAAKDWSKYAYSQYATDQHYLCNSLMIFDSLQRLKSPADRLLFYPKTWDTDVSSSKDRTSQLLVLARDKYNVKLRPVEMYTLKRQSKQAEETWDASINKLHAWNQGEYDRIIHIDSDVAVLQNIDELFFLPLSKGSPVAMPRAYWKLDEPENEGGGHKLSSLLVVLQPNKKEADVLWEMAAGEDSTSSASLPPNGLFDMELLNSRYINNALTIPHRPYALVTGEFRRIGKKNHTQYLGNIYEPWDPEIARAEAKIIHFSDWPLPKPWIMWPNSLLRELRPECEFNSGTPDEHGCEGRRVWMELYDDFRRRRKDVCKLLSVPAPDWPPKAKGKKVTHEHDRDEH